MMTKEKERKKGGTWMYGVESTMVIDGVGF